jgi:hypothetical protein
MYGGLFVVEVEVTREMLERSHTNVVDCIKIIRVSS